MALWVNGFTIHWDKTQILKQFRSDKIKDTKNAFFLLSRAPAYHSLSHYFYFVIPIFADAEGRLSKTVCGIFHFQFRFIFSKVSIFVQQNAWTLSL